MLGTKISRKAYQNARRKLSPIMEEENNQEKKRFVQKHKLPLPLPRIQNTYPYNITTRNAIDQYQALLAAIKNLGIGAAAPYVQNHKAPKPKSRIPKSRAYIGKQTHKPVGTWKGKKQNGHNVGEFFLKPNGSKFTQINQGVLNYYKTIKRKQKKTKSSTQQIQVGNQTVAQRKQAFECAKKQNQKPTNLIKRNSLLSRALLQKFNGGAPVRIPLPFKQNSRGVSRGVSPDVRLTVR